MYCDSSKDRLGCVLMQSRGVVAYGSDECLKYSGHTRVYLTFLALFYI